MTAVVTKPTRPASTEVPVRVLGPLVRVLWRLVRRSVMLVWLSVAAYLTIEVLVFRSTYPDQQSREQLLRLSTSTAVRIMQGSPGAVDTSGGFAIWDGGWMLMIIVSAWALMTATRLTRAEEDTGRGQLLLCRPCTRAQHLTAVLMTLGLACVGIAFSAALPFIVLGEPVLGGALWGTGLGLLGAVAAATGAVLAQVLEPRRRVVSAGLALLTAAFLVRVVANSADDRTWLLRLTPYGWLESIGAFAANRVWWLLPPIVAALLLGSAALLLCDRRDEGAAILRSSEAHRSRFGLLGSATGFGWRLTSGSLIGWLLTSALLTFVFGMMTRALIDYINSDPTYRNMLESMGMDMSTPTAGYLSYIAVSLSLAFAGFVSWRIGAVRNEEAEGRLDNLLVRVVVRWRWLALTALSAFVAGALVVATCAVALWAGARTVDVPVTVRQVVEPMAGTLPLVALFTGIAVLAFGVVPRLTVAVPVTVAVLSYLLQTFGSLLEWPHWVIALSPFHHLANLPASPMTTTAVIAMTGLGLAFAAAGILAFTRRDLKGA